MPKKFAQLIQLLRLSHWSKAVFIFLGVIYSGELKYFFAALLAALAFNLIASSVYIYNDFIDRCVDRHHPRKCTRPLAQESISSKNALALLFSLLSFGLILGIYVSLAVFFLLITYIIINLVYNHFFKKIFLLDVLCIASGFMLRVLVGTWGIDLTISWWLILNATLASLFLALCKRRLEKQLDSHTETREVLKKYTSEILSKLTISCALACFLIYSMYIFMVHSSSPYFIITLPFAGIGLSRFIWLSINERYNDDLVSLFFNDSLSFYNFICFAFLTIRFILLRF